jgi:hypothetical protein
LGCSTTPKSKFSYHTNYSINTPIKDDKCYDAAVLLELDLSRSGVVAKKALKKVDAKIQEKTDTYIKAQRRRHIGIFLGRGGEILIVRLKKVKEKYTFVTVATGIGIFGEAGSEPWSCRVIDEILKRASRGEGPGNTKFYRDNLRFGTNSTIF